MNDASCIEGGEGATPRGLPVHLFRGCYKGEAPTEPGAIGRRGGTLQVKVRTHFNHQVQTGDYFRRE